MARTPDNIDALTGLRGFATLTVLAFHLWEFLGSRRIGLGPLDLTPVFAQGHLGVDIFFVLSGFLVVRPFLRHALGTGPRPGLARYVWRRIRRVVPAYWANLLILTLVIAAATGRAPLDGIGLLGHLTFLFWYTQPLGTLPFNPVWWTLPIEWWAYFVLPPLALLLTRIPSWLWLALVLALVFWIRIEFVRHYFADDQGYWWQAPDYRHLRARFDQFALGLLAAWYFERGLSARAARVLGWTGLVLLGAVLIYIGWFVPRWLHDAIRPWLYLHYTALAVPIAMLVLAIAAGWRPLARCFEGRVLLFSGTISYSLYLWHFPVFEWLFRHAPALSAWPLPMRAAVALAMAFAISWVAYRCFERPFLSARARGDKPATSDPQSVHA